MQAAGEIVEHGHWGGVGRTHWVCDEEIRSFQVASDGEVVVSVTFHDSNKIGGGGGNLSKVSPSSINGS